jgi:hypothetical protein
MASEIVGMVESLLERFHVKHGRLPKTSDEILAVKREAEKLEESSRMKPKRA